MTKKKNELLTREEALRLSWKNRKDYIGEDRKSSLYTSWRARVFTTKGRMAGFSDSWKTFKGFKNEMSHDWSDGKILVRKKNNLPFSRENCEWVEKGMENLGKLVLFEYNGVTKTLIEWAMELNVNYNGIRQRFFRGKEYTKEQILYGKFFKSRGDIQDHKALEYQKRRDKISKMLSAYRLKDKKQGRVFDLTWEYFEQNILLKPCVYCGSTENVGCDRIDNKKGHSIDNILPACYVCNTIRNNHFTVDEMKVVGKTVAQVMKARIGA